MTVPVLYQAPNMLEESNLSDIVCRELNIDAPKPDMTEWNEMLRQVAACKDEVDIAIVGKYVKLHDAYLSVAESLHHAGIANGVTVNIGWVDAETVTDETAADILSKYDGLLVPGGFGDRGVEGKICTAKYARENNVPYFGICLGMQTAVIEFARHVLKLSDANSSEFDEHGLNSVIDLMPDQQGNIPKGGTMRLGAYPCKIKPGTKMSESYDCELIQERHRHRYEFNNDYREKIEQYGMKITGTSPDNRLVEAVEIPANDYFVAVQYHPEFKSRPNRAHPLFKSFVKASVDHKNK